jgi:hypothetical protein
MREVHSGWGRPKESGPQAIHTADRVGLAGLVEAQAKKTLDLAAAKQF